MYKIQLRKSNNRKRKSSGDAKQTDKLKKCFSESEKTPQSSVAEIEENGPDIRKPKKKSLVSQRCAASFSDNEDEKHEACIFCNALYLESKSGKGWIQCLSCQGWAHEACSRAEEDDTFLCDFCVM